MAWHDTIQYNTIQYDATNMQDRTFHAPDAKAAPAIAPVCRIQCAGVRAQVVSEGTTIRRSGPVEQVGSSGVVICRPQVARASKVEWMSTKFIPTISLITNINWVTRARVCAVGDAGMRLHPTTGTDLSGSTDTTYTPNGYTLINTNPYYFVRSGDVGGSTLYYFTGGAGYWSSTAVSASQAYSLYFYSGVVYPAHRYIRYRGWSLRCVTRRRHKRKVLFL